MTVLISPAVPSLPTTAPTKHTLQPSHIIVQMAAILWATTAHDAGFMHEMELERPTHPAASGSAAKDVITALRC